MSRLALRRFCRSAVSRRSIPTPVPTSSIGLRASAPDPLAPTHPVDALCIPLGPAPAIPVPPAPSISDQTLLKLHDLSALNPPGPLGSKEWDTLKEEVTSMIGVVEAVRAVDTSSIDAELEQGQVPDGRIWPQERGIAVDWDQLVADQRAFVAARQANIPGTPTSLHRQAPVAKLHLDESGALQAEAVLGMAKEGVQKVRRRGLGKNPDKESSYYSVKAPKRGSTED